MVDLNRRDFALGTAATGLALATGAAGAAAGSDRAAVYKEIERRHDAPTVHATADLPGYYVNDFGAVGDGLSHPLSERYPTLEAAQSVYPHATSLTDEIDWCAWQAASDFVRTRLDYGYQSKNWGAGKILADGRYVVNKPIQFSHCGIIVQGVTCGERYVLGGATSVTYNGPDGTDSNKVAIFDFFPVDETGASPPGLYGVHGSGVFKCYDIGIFGKGAGHSASIASAPSTTGYVWGIRLRNGSFCEVSRCTFGGSLLDGIVACSQLFLRISFNFFYGVHRDCISILGATGDFSTTMWIDDNEFGYFGRYALLLNLNGSVEPSPSVRRNSCEGLDGAGYYAMHPEWFVQGVVSPFCQIGGTYGQYSENRFEGDMGTNCWGTMHFISIGNLRITNNRGGSLIFASYRADPNRVTSAYRSFMAANKYVDITDTRNFHASTTTDFNSTSVCTDVSLDLLSQGYMISLGGVGLSGNTAHDIRNAVVHFLFVPVNTAGTYYRVYPPLTAVTSSPAVSLCAQLTNSVYLNHLNHGPLSCPSFNTRNNTGAISVYTSHGFGTWTATTAYLATSAPNAPKKKKWIQPTIYNGYVYECTESGISGGREPVWPTAIGATVTDGEVTWRCAFPIHLSPPFASETMFNGQRTCIGDAAPTTGHWSIGDRMLTRLPAAAGHEGWVCTTAGIPGTWKTFGAISA